LVDEKNQKWFPPIQQFLLANCYTKPAPLLFLKGHYWPILASSTSINYSALAGGLNLLFLLISLIVIPCLIFVGPWFLLGSMTHISQVSQNGVGFYCHVGWC
jgi:hypothetical protein